MQSNHPSIEPAPSEDSPGAEDRAAQVAGIFRAHNRTLVGFLVSRLRNEQEAMEIAQEAYVKVLQLEPKHGAVSYLRSYLFRTAENLAVDRMRQRRSRGRLATHQLAFMKLLSPKHWRRFTHASCAGSALPSPFASLAGWTRGRK